MKRAFWLAILLCGAVAIASADSIAVDGSVYTLFYNPTPVSHTSTTQTFEITYQVDTTHYKYAGTLQNPTSINSVGSKVSSSLAAVSQPVTLIAAPGGVSQWKASPGGLNNNGCSGNGGGWECVGFSATGHGAKLSGILVWVYDVVVPTGSLFTPSLAPSRSTTPTIKAEYVDSTGKKVGGLVAQPLDLTSMVTAAEPDILDMLASLGALAALGFFLLIHCDGRS